MSYKWSLIPFAVHMEQTYGPHWRVGRTLDVNEQGLFRLSAKTSDGTEMLDGPEALLIVDRSDIEALRNLEVKR